MIKVVNVSKSYTNNGKTQHVLNNVSIDVANGQVFGIIGRSGAGKSTLLKCLNLLEKPDSGKILVDGVDLTQISAKELREQRQQIGVIFQHFNLLNSKTIFDNVALPLILQGNHNKEEITSSVNEMLELVGLQEFAKKYPSSLSGGQKQRVGIARALITKPKLLLSDEATSALDPQTTASILDLLLEINKKLGITVVLITHELEVVRKICDKVAVISGGKIIEQGEAFKLLLHPQHQITRKLIIEEEFDTYLEQVQDFYKFDSHPDRHLLLVSFIGEVTFQPIFKIIADKTNVSINMLRAEIGRIKALPFGQALVELEGDNDKLKLSCEVMRELGVHYEILR